jgi:hypothetical protein
MRLRSKHRGGVGKVFSVGERFVVCSQAPDRLRITIDSDWDIIIRPAAVESDDIPAIEVYRVERWRVATPGSDVRKHRA